MTGLTWYRLEIHTLGTEFDSKEVFNDLYNSFDVPKKIFNEEGHTEEYGVWDTIVADMTTFSAKYPGVEFEFTCDDNDGSYWREWYKNGLSAYAEAQIVYPEIEQGMYS